MVEESGDEDDDGDPTIRATGDHRSWIFSIDGDSLLLDTFWVFFKSQQQPVFRASSQLHGRYGRKVADLGVEPGC